LKRIFTLILFRDTFDLSKATGAPIIYGKCKLKFEAVIATDDQGIFSEHQNKALHTWSYHGKSTTYLLIKTVKKLQFFSGDTFVYR
jgi:hypothetical protein